jgi:hypothetical protein
MFVSGTFWRNPDRIPVALPSIYTDIFMDFPSLKADILIVPGSISLGVKLQGVKLTTQFLLVPRSRMVEIYLNSPICLYGTMHT